MTKSDARTLIAGLLHDGLDAGRLTLDARREIRAALDLIIERCDLPGVRDMIWQCKTLTPSLLTEEQAKDRLKQINQHVYRCLQRLPDTPK